MAFLVALPPPQYDHPFPGQVVEKRLSFAEVRRVCKGGLACSWPRVTIRSKDGKIIGSYCLVILPLHDRGTLKRHEVAHCNGWPADHPGGFWVRWSDEDFFSR